VVQPLLDNLRALTRSVAQALGGASVDQPGLTGSVSSKFDRFLNQLFASPGVPPQDALAALGGRPGFVWLAGKPRAQELGGLRLLEMSGMTATTAAAPAERAAPQCEIGEVRSREDLDGWFGVYSEVFGADPNARQEWARINEVLGPEGEGSLLLLLARVNGMPAATGAAFFRPDEAGLYCFTTLETMRRRGLGSGLVRACHAAARDRGIEHAVLQATGAGRRVYARIGYREDQSLHLLRPS